MQKTERDTDSRGLISNFLFEWISGKSEHLTFFPLLVSALSNLVYTITERRFCKRHISIFAKMGNKSTAVFREKIFREINLTKNVFPIQNLSPIYWYFAVFPHKISRTFLAFISSDPKMNQSNLAQSFKANILACHCHQNIRFNSHYFTYPELLEQLLLSIECK